MTLSQQLREAGEKASPGPWEADVVSQGFLAVLNGLFAEHGSVDILSAVLDGQHKADARLIVLLRNNLDTIIAALEAQEAVK